MVRRGGIATQSMFEGSACGWCRGYRKVVVMMVFDQGVCGSDAALEHGGIRYVPPRE